MHRPGRCIAPLGDPAVDGTAITGLADPWCQAKVAGKLSGLANRRIPPIDAITAVAITALMPATVLRLRICGSSSEIRIGSRSSVCNRPASRSNSSRCPVFEDCDLRETSMDVHF